MGGGGGGGGGGMLYFQDVNLIYKQTQSPYELTHCGLVMLMSHMVVANGWAMWAADNNTETSQGNV